MAIGSFKDNPGYKKLKTAANWGMYDESTLADALGGTGLSPSINDIYRSRDEALADPLLAGVPE